MARELSSAEFQNEVLNSKGTVLIDFFATWCEPCKMLAPILEELGTEMKETVKVFKVDVDKSGDIAQKYNISGVPTVIIFRNGTVVDQMVGFKPKKILKSKLEEYTA